MAPTDLHVAPSTTPKATGRSAGPPAPQSGADHSFASATVGVHLRRGAVGFAALTVALFLWPRVGWVALAPAAVGAVALRGCPTCWTIGLVQTISRSRYRRVCTDGGCRLDTSPRSPDGSAGTV